MSKSKKVTQVDALSKAEKEKGLKQVAKNYKAIEQAKRLKRDAIVDRSKKIFFLHMDQMLLHFEGFYREDLEDNLEALRRMEASDSFKNGKQKQQSIKRQKEIIKEMKITTKKFITTNENFQKVMSKGFSEDSLDRLEVVGENVEAIIRSLFDPTTNLDMSILINAYHTGRLNNVLGRIKKELDIKK